MISWAGREPLTISDFSSLTCDQAVLRFSHFLWEAWSQVISIFATSNVNKNRFRCLIECHINTIIYKQKRNNIVLGKTVGSLQASYPSISSICGYLFDSVHFVGQGEGWKLWQKLNKFIQTAECAIMVIGAIQLTKRMQIFLDTGAKFHEFPLRCSIAEENLIYDNLLNNKRKTKQHICYMHILWKNIFSACSKWRFKQIRLSACLLLIVERIGWKSLPTLRIKLTER